MEKLAALVPIPRVHLIRYHGCLAPHAKRGLEKGGVRRKTGESAGIEEEDEENAALRATLLLSQWVQRRILVHHL